MTALAAPRWQPVAAAACAALAVALVGGVATDLGLWYQGLHQPSFKPPDWLFGPVWTLMFGLVALAGVSAWTHAPDRAARSQVVRLFALNAALTLAWSVLFFRLQRPDWALVEVIFLWLSVAVMIMRLGPQARAVNWLLVPYLAWVTFAALLNLAVVRLNAPF